MIPAARRAPTVPATLAALGAALAAGAFALFAAGYLAAATDNTHAVTSSVHISASILARTALVAAAIAAISTFLAFPAALAMRARGVGFACLLAAPLILPPYLAHAAWGLARAPGTALGDLVQRADPRLFTTINTAQAILGLSLFAWPVAAIVMLPGARRLTDAHLDALAGAQPGALRRAVFLSLAMRRSITLAFAVVALLMLGSAVPFHVANVETLAIEVWRAIAESASPAAAMRAGAPLAAVALAAGIFLSFLLTRDRSPADTGAIITTPSRASLRSPALVAAACVWAASTIAPMILMFTSLREPASLARTPALIGAATIESLGVGAIVGVIGAALALAAFAGFARNAGRAPRILASLTLAITITVALTPGVLVGASVLSASHFPGLDRLASTNAGAVVAHTLRFGAVASIAGLWLARAETRDESDLRSIETQDSPLAWLRAIGADRIGALAAIGVVMALLSVHEIESAVLLTPPGAAGLAQTLLNQLHYLRMEELSAAGVWMFALGLGFAGLSAALAAMRARALRAAALLIAASLFVGCDDHPPTAGAPIRAVAISGEIGRAPGQLIYPRAFDTDGESLFIIDKTARVQRWSLAGEPLNEWTMPEFSRGKPTGVTVGPDGLVYVADTHEHRVAVFNASGEMIDSWGAYGFGPGEFIYPTDVTFKSDAAGEIRLIYVSEYGGNDRVSAFDADHNYLFSFDGSQTGDRFARPQSIVYDPAHDVIYVADASNHRVAVLSAQGEPLTSFGRADQLPGDADGEFRYPYGLALADDGTLLVAEFGGHRVRRINPVTGATLEISGRGGDGPGELRSPWAVAVVGRRAFVLDSGHNRVIEFELTRAAGFPISPASRTKESGTGVPPVRDDSSSGTGVPPVRYNKTSGAGVPPVPPAAAANFADSRGAPSQGTGALRPSVARGDAHGRDARATVLDALATVLDALATTFLRARVSDANGSAP